ncbi:hypothetical protein SB690_19820, partial [Bacillus sp. SIMBA_006]|uniref:hypothetical protein n=1 Tax=Bacillus sp. SIMBA_006 TaxID=3085755 RepID=UPI00397B1AF7
SVRYVEIPGNPALATLKKLLGAYDRLHKSSEAITRVFSEVKDAQLSRELLLIELKQQLQVPVNSTLSRAQTNIELLRPERFWSVPAGTAPPRLQCARWT